MDFTPPTPDCPLCPRLAAFREDNRSKYPDYFNAPVPSFGAADAEMLIVGLAPGLKGANRTGRPFTGDYAGEVLYSSLKKSGFAEGQYDPESVRLEARGLGHKGLLPREGLRSRGDSLRLINCRISNAVRCVPPENKPEISEIRTCNRFLANEVAAMSRLKVIFTLGQIAHKAVLMALGLRQSAFKFGHGTEHFLRGGNASPNSAPRNFPREVVVKDSSTLSTPRPLTLINSYHCSRYNINTGALTQAMFDEVVRKAKKCIADSAREPVLAK